MNAFFYIVANLALVATFLWLMKRKNLLTFFENKRWWLTWLAIGIITLMDELTSVYYASYEAYRFIGIKAIMYIALTSIVIRFLSTRMVEISEILEVNGIKGGGVYSFSYMVFGPSVSFIAVSSILVDYILTATLSTVSAVENGVYFMPIGEEIKFIAKFGVIAAITLLNIGGIKENAKFTYGIFVAAAFILTNLIIGGFIHFDAHSVATVHEGFNGFWNDLFGGTIFHGYTNLIIGIGSCILAYSGIESVLQTASLAKSWKEIKKAYLFLAFTVGIVTPLIALLALSSNIDISAHENDLIPTFAAYVNGPIFGVLVGVLACITLIMAVNTAMVASAELIEKIAERYHFDWIISLNKRQSLYRIHIMNGIFYSIILIITSGSQAMLAEMYAVGLVASFCINVGSLIYYRYKKGHAQITYHTSRFGSILLFILLVSTFAYIIIHRPYGALLWLIIVTLVLVGGLWLSKYRAPEIKARKAGDSIDDVLTALEKIEANTVHLFFRRPRETDKASKYGTLSNSFFISFYSPRMDHPSESDLTFKHYWLPIENRQKLINMITNTLKSIDEQFKDSKDFVVHIGWPLSSWWDRLSIGAFVFNLISLPKHFPQMYFTIEYLKGNYTLYKKKKNK